MAKDKIKISFVGSAADDVTGSCIWIKTPTKQILLECGLYQHCGSTLDAYKINNKHFDFKPKDIDYVFVMHCHADHLCLAPKLYAKGCKAPLIMPAGSYEIAKILLQDSANIMRADAEELSKKYKRQYNPIYNDDNVNDCLRHYCEYEIGTSIICLDDDVRFRFVPSGHILNACQLELWVTNGNLTKKIVYTSDLGNPHIEKYYTNKFECVEKCDVLIGETTYAHETRIANRKMREKDLQKLKSSILQTCVDEGARVLIPTFANDRTQNMLTYLYDIFGEDKSFTVPILIDSPMATKCCQAYTKILQGEQAAKWHKVLQWKNIHFVDSSTESRRWRDSREPVVVLASSGMLVKGRSVGWAYAMLPRSQDRIIFCGYSAEGSIGYIIKEGKQKSVTISGVRRANKCQVTILHSFSSHAQRDTLMDYYSSVQCNKIILVHGEMSGKIQFAHDLQMAVFANNNTSKVVVAQKGYELLI